MRPSGSLQTRVRHPLLPTTERGETIASADDIDREITALKDRLTALDRERSKLADRLSVLEHVRVRELAVEPQQVVLGEAEAADGCLRIQATMRPVPVVAMQPSQQFCGAAIGVGVWLSVGPLAQRALNKAFGLAVGLGCVRLGPDVLEAEIATGVAEIEGSVTTAIVGHDTGDGDAEALVIGEGSVQEGDSALFRLIGHDLGEGDARGVVDADMDKLPTQPLAAAATVALAAAIAGDAMADTIDAAKLFDVDVDQLARVLAFIAADGFARFQRAQAVQPEAAQDARDGGFRDAGLARDLGAGPALPPQCFDARDSRGRGGTAQPMRPRGTVLQTGQAF